MKFAVPSVLSLLIMSVTTAGAVTLYEDPATGQVFTRPGAGRVEIMDFPGTASCAAEDSAADRPTVATVVPGAENGGGGGGGGITILNPESQDFLLGKETHINMKFVPEDASDMWFTAGVRIQGSYENTNTDFTDPSIPDTDLADAYLRRARLEISAGFGERASFVMDIRNDKVNHLLKGEGNFQIGDAYLRIKEPFDTSLVNFKFYRAKIDVSRTETVKSARVIAYDRPFIADAAAQFISFNRRATNAQVYGDWKKKIHYQLAFGDATQDDKLRDSVGASDAVTTDQSYFYGGKVVFSPFDGWEETSKTETYFGEGKHFSFGAAYWSVPQTKGTVESTGTPYDLNHELVNLEVSAHYKGFFIQGEYFDFQDVVEDWSAPTLNIGSSDGWYVTSEYVMPNLGYIAPFARYETWDAFEGKDGFELDSVLFGINWYLRGNTTKIGLVYQNDKFGSAIGDREESKIRIVSQWFF